jgi:hypothetical protein
MKIKGRKTMGIEKREKESVIAFHQYEEVNDKEIDVEIYNLNQAVSPITMLARRLEQNKISKQDAATALRGMAILINHKCKEIIDTLTDNIDKEKSNNGN